MQKKYITVETKRDSQGNEIPKKIFWNDGRVFLIKKVLYKCNCVENEFDGIRYTVLIDNLQRDIYLDEDGQWYVEARRRFCV